MKLINHGILFLMALATVACGSTDPLEKVTFADSGKSFNLISGSSRCGSAICDGVEYYAVFDDENKKATVTISNLRLETEDEPMSFTFSELDWHFGPSSHTMQRVIEREELVPDNDFGTGHRFSDFVMVYSQANEFDPSESAGFYIRYIIDDHYTVTAFPEKILCRGTTIVMETDSGRKTVSYDTDYAVTLKAGERCSADMTITGLPVYGRTITVTGLNLTLTPRGYGLDSGSSTRVTAGRGGDGVTLLSLEATADMLDDLTIDMRLAVAGITYSVQAYLSPNLAPTR